MGADFKDYDGDGRPDIFMTALSNETFPLFRNEGNGMFREETFASRLGGQSLAWGGWSTGMVDLDNDGFLDLFVAGGHVQPNEELYSSRSSRQSNRVFRNLGDGTFGDVTRACGADFQQLGLHRGAAFGDLDDDGRVDAVVTRLNEPVEVFLNRAEPSGHYLLVRLSARAPTGTAWARPSASSSARDGRWSGTRPPPSATAAPATSGCTSDWGAKTGSSGSRSPGRAAGARSWRTRRPTRSWRSGSMSDRRSDRRQFLKTAGISAAGLGLARNARGGEVDCLGPSPARDTPAPAPFPALSSVFEGPRSRFFGVKAEERDEPFGDGRSGRRRKLVPRDPKTYYMADGLSGEEEPHSFQLTFEVTNNSILCSATQSGLLKHPCIFSRMVPARRRGRDLVSEELVGGSPWASAC